MRDQCTQILYVIRFPVFFIWWDIVEIELSTGLFRDVWQCLFLFAAPLSLDHDDPYTVIQLKVISLGHR